MRYSEWLKENKEDILKIHQRLLDGLEESKLEEITQMIYRDEYHKHINIALSLP